MRIFQSSYSPRCEGSVGLTKLQSELSPCQSAPSGMPESWHPADTWVAHGRHTLKEQTTEEGEKKFLRGHILYYISWNTELLKTSVSNPDRPSSTTIQFSLQDDVRKGLKPTSHAFRGNSFILNSLVFAKTLVASACELSPNNTSFFSLSLPPPLSHLLSLSRSLNLSLSFFFSLSHTHTHNL